MPRFGNDRTPAVVDAVVAARDAFTEAWIDEALAGLGLSAVARARDLDAVGELATGCTSRLWIVDAELDGDAIATSRDLLERQPGARIVLICDAAAERTCLEALGAGVAGVTERSASCAALGEDLFDVTAGQCVVPRRLVGRLVTELGRL